MTGHWLSALGVSLAVTLFVELVFALACGRRGAALLLTAAANLVTNPAVVLAVRMGGAPMWVMEALAVLAEALVYRRSGRFPRPFLFSLCANALSFGLGLLIPYIIS